MITKMCSRNYGFVERRVDETSLGESSSTSSFCNKQHDTELWSSLNKPFISTITPDKEEMLHNDTKYASPKFCHEPSLGQQCSSTQSLFNGINVLCGIGMLAGPYAIKEGGWSGLFLLLIFGVISCYTALLLKRCLDSSPGLQSYPDIGQFAFGTTGRIAVCIVLSVELYALAVEYLIQMSDNLSSLFPNVELGFYEIHLDSHYFFSIVATLIVLPIVCLGNLSFLSYLSVGGVGASLVVVFCLLWVGVVGQIGFHPGGTLLELKGMPIAVGLYAGSYSGHSIFPNIYTSMAKPSQFPTLLIICFALCWFIYTGVGICGYMMFGDNIKSQFTLNMPHKFLSTKVAVWTTVVNPLSKYPLVIYPVALSLEELLPSAQLRSYFILVIIRTILVISTLVVSLTVPFFAYNGVLLVYSNIVFVAGLLMALIGSFSTMLVALIFPCACYLSILGRRLGRLEIGVNIFIIVVGAVCCCIGSYSTVMRIFQELSH